MSTELKDAGGEALPLPEDIVIKVEPLWSTSENSNPGPASSTETPSGENLKEFQCPQCFKQYRDKADLKSHSRVHTRNHKCPHCDKRFCKTSSLHRHLRVHGDKSRSRPGLICEMCGKTLVDKRGLRDHKLAIHDGVKPYMCRFCPATFSGRGGMRQHEHRHTGEKAFTCEVCGKTCNRQCNLKAHMKLHTAERKFECSACDGKFMTKARLNDHMISHTGEKTFECDVCAAKLSRRGTLRTHKFKVHGIMMPARFQLQGRKPDNNASESSSELDD